MIRRIRRPLLVALFFAGAILTLASLPTSAELLDYEQYLHLEGRAHIAGDWEPHAIDWDNEYLFVAGGQGGLFVFWQLPNWEPTFVAHLSLLDEAFDIAMHSDLAFVADGDAGLVIVDAHDPTAPEIIGALSLGDAARSVTYNRDYVIVGGQQAVYFIDYSDPRDPQLVHFIATGGCVEDIALNADESLAYLATADVGLHVVDLTQIPPVIVGGNNSYPDARSVEAYDTHAYLGTQFGTDGYLQVFDMTHPDVPVHVYTFSIHQPVLDLFVKDSELFAALGEGSTRTAALGIFSLSLPYSPVLLSKLPTVGLPEGVVVRPDRERAYLASQISLYHTGVEVVSLVDLQSVPAHSSNPLTMPFAIGIDGGYLYVADNDDGLLVLDAGDLSQIGSCPLADGPPTDLEQQGDLLYIACAMGGLQTVDVVDPNSPRPLDALWMLPPNQDVAVTGDIACVAGGSNGLYIVDASDPQDLQHIATFEPDPDMAYFGVDAAEGFAFACATTDTGATQLDVIDVRDPYNPTRLGFGRLYYESYGVGVACHIDHTVLVAGTSGLWVIDVSNMYAPRNRGYIRYPAVANFLGGGQVTADENTAYVVGVDIGVMVFDIRDLDNLHSVGFLYAEGHPWQLAIGPEETYVTAYDGALYVAPRHVGGTADITTREIPATALQLLPSRPNPLTATTSLQYHLGQAGATRLAICDPSGRQVRLLVDALQSAGQHRMIWDGRSTAGALLEGGVYFATLETASGRSSRRLVIVR